MNWTITLHGFGNVEGARETLAGFVKSLEAQGQHVNFATVTGGALEISRVADLTYASPIEITARDVRALASDPVVSTPEEAAALLGSVKGLEPETPPEE